MSMTSAHSPKAANVMTPPRGGAAPSATTPPRDRSAQHGDTARGSGSADARAAASAGDLPRAARIAEALLREADLADSDAQLLSCEALEWFAESGHTDVAVRTHERWWLAARHGRHGGTAVALTVEFLARSGQLGRATDLVVSRLSHPGTQPAHLFTDQFLRACQGVLVLARREGFAPTTVAGVPLDEFLGEHPHVVEPWSQSFPWAEHWSEVDGLASTDASVTDDAQAPRDLVALAKHASTLRLTRDRTLRHVLAQWDQGRGMPAPQTRREHEAAAMLASFAVGMAAVAQRDELIALARRHAQAARNPILGLVSSGLALRQDLLSGAASNTHEIRRVIRDLRAAGNIVWAAEFTTTVATVDPEMSVEQRIAAFHGAADDLAAHNDVGGAALALLAAASWSVADPRRARADLDAAGHLISDVHSDLLDSELLVTTAHVAMSAGDVGAAIDLASRAALGAQARSESRATATEIVSQLLVATAHEDAVAVTRSHVADVRWLLRPVATAQAHGLLGIALLNAGLAAEATESLEIAVTAAADEVDRERLVFALGEAYDALGSTETSAHFYRAAASSAHRRADVASEARALLGAGIAELDGEHDVALTTLRRAEDAARTAGRSDIFLEARCARSCAVLNAEGLGSAEGVLDSAVAPTLLIADATGDDDVAQIDVEERLALQKITLAMLAGRTERALEWADVAFVLGERRGVGLGYRAVASRADALAAASDHDEAVACLYTELARLEGSEHWPALAHHTAHLLRSLGRSSEAEQLVHDISPR